MNTCFNNTYGIDAIYDVNGMGFVWRDTKHPIYNIPQEIKDIILNEAVMAVRDIDNRKIFYFPNIHYRTYEIDVIYSKNLKESFILKKLKSHIDSTRFIGDLITTNLLIRYVNERSTLLKTRKGMHVLLCKNLNKIIHYDCLECKDFENGHSGVLFKIGYEYGYN